jgi:CubicO group peptidase (beta-lactamase class C family)
MMIARVMATAVALCSLAANLDGQARPSVAVAHHLADSLARDFVARGEAPSVAVAVLRGNDTILIAAYGMADLENSVAATPQSLYRIGSVTKQFTAAAVMQLVEQGKVALDDSIAKHLADLPEAWRGVTVRQLLNHTSGIKSYTALGPEWVKRWGEEMPPRTVIGLVATQPMDFAPGTKWAYNNTGYILLGILIDHLTGTRWGADLTTRFATPLGIPSVTNCMNGPVLPKRVRGYEKFGSGWQNAAYLAMSQPYAAGAICATVGDIARWNRALHMGNVVSPASYTLMTTPEGAAATGAMKYGFGLAPATIAGVAVISHGGGIHGFISANVWVPGDQISITVLANSGSAKSGELQEKLLRAVLGVKP